MLKFDPTKTTAPPWHVERNQIKNAKREVLGSYPYSLGGIEDHQNGLLMAKAPELLEAVIAALLVTRDIMDKKELTADNRLAVKSLNKLLERVIK